MLLLSFLFTNTPLFPSPPSLLASPSNSDSVTATLARPPAFYRLWKDELTDVSKKKEKNTENREYINTATAEEH